MQLSNLLLAVLGLGASVAVAAPTDAAPAVSATPAAVAEYCDKFDGRERRECREQPGYCNKYDGRERRDCEAQYRPPYQQPSSGGYCNKFDGRERRECESNPGYCNKFDGRERRECDARGYNPVVTYAPAGPIYNGYCNKYDGRERRDCESQYNYCDKFQGRERKDCRLARGLSEY